MIVRAKYKDRYLSLSVIQDASTPVLSDDFYRRFAAHAFEISERHKDISSINSRLSSLYKEAELGLIKIFRITLNVHITIEPNDVEIVEKEH